MANRYGSKVLDPQAFERQAQEIKTSSRIYGWKVVGRQEEPAPPAPPAPPETEAPPVVPPATEAKPPEASEAATPTTPTTPPKPADLSIRQMEKALAANAGLVADLLEAELKHEPAPRISALSLLRKAEKTRGDGGRHPVLTKIDEAVKALDTAPHAEG